MSEYNLHTIRELLGEAFSSGEITTLAFDLFHSVYQDFAAGMTRSQKIEMVVNHANQKGMLPELLAYIQQHNVYQYGRFEDQLKTKSATAKGVSSSGTNIGASKRRLLREKENLESQLEIKSKLVRELTEAFAFETDIPRKNQIGHQLKQAEKELGDIEDKLDSLEKQF